MWQVHRRRVVDILQNAEMIAFLALQKCCTKSSGLNEDEQGLFYGASFRAGGILKL